MAEKITLKLSAAAAAFVNKDATKEARLQAARGDVDVSARDLVTLQFFLGHDQDPEVRSSALRSLRELPEPLLAAMAESAETHPKILDMLARLHYPKQAVAAKLALHPGIESQTLAFLAEKGVAEAVRSCQASAPETPEVEGADAAETDEAEEAEEAEEVEEVDEESERFKTKYHLSLKMEIPEKVKMALIGDKEWRTLMLKDANSLVSESVLKNPRITEPEILTIIKSNAHSEDVLRIICRNKEWIKNYQIRKSLVLNCKTPLPTSLRLLTTLNEKDIAILAKSKNIPSVLSTQARKLFLNKKRD